MTDATRIADIAAARTRFGARAPVLVETTLLRRRALEKLGHVSDWLFTDEALQQATAAPVALHRAARLAAAGAVIHDATCSIGTELAALQRAGARALGSDIDTVRLAMARHNLGAGIDLCRADALHPVTRDTVVLVDPGRRRGGRRRFSPDDYQPGLGQLIDSYQGRDLVVKCAPGIDFEQVRRLGFDGEIEVTSYRGSVREACLWSAGLGLALLRQSSEMCGGTFDIRSVQGRGTSITASMRLSHMDRPPLGDLNATILALCASNEAVEVQLHCRSDDGTFHFNSQEGRPHEPRRTQETQRQGATTSRAA